MPIPKPEKGEKQQDFISRCMGDKVMNDDYPDQKQRAGVCYQSWTDKNKKTSGQMIMPELLENFEFLAGQPVSSINQDKRTVDVVFFTGVDVPRMNFWTGEKYILRFDPSGADLTLLNNGAPVLDNHSHFDGSASQKGKVEKAWEESGKWMATLRFSKRQSVDDLWQDLSDRIVTKFSMGVEILQSKKISEDDNQVLVAEKWRPYELSVAPIPADWGTMTLAGIHRPAPAETESVSSATSAAESVQTSNIVINNVQMGTSPEESNMPDKVETTGTGAQSDVTQMAQTILDDRVKAELQAAVVAETARILTIRKITTQLGLPVSFGDRHIEGKTAADKFGLLAIEEQARLAMGANSTRQHRGSVEMISDEQDTRRGCMTEAMTALMDHKAAKVDRNNPFVGGSVKSIAAESVRQQFGLRSIGDMNRVIELSMQNTADFAYVLENVARKQLLNRYEAIAPTYRVWCKRSTTPDFKTMSRVRLSEAPSMLVVPEGAQITIGTMSDSRETYTLATYGRGVSFTRQMLINDDLGAFNDLIGQFGVQAARLENKTVYAILYANANMADSNPLFDDTTHHNTGTGAIGNTAFDTMFGKMGAQLGIDGVTVLNLVPKYLIVPKAKEATAIANLLPTGPNLAASSQNWFSGRLVPVADGELDTNGSGTTKWYSAADPELFPGIEYCHLQGQEGPQFIRKDNESGILGIQFYCFLDFAAKAVDWRPLYYSTGS